MENRGYTHYPWTKEELFEKTAKYSTLKDFRENEPAAHSVLSPGDQGNGQPSPWAKYWEEATAHLTREPTTAQWSDEELVEFALQYPARIELQKADQSVYTAIRRRGLEEKAFAHMELRTGFWTIEECKKEALKHKTRREMELGEGGLFKAIKRHGILDECCSHMEDNGYSCNQWTREELIVRAKKYSTIADFTENDWLAYHSLHSSAYEDIVKEATAHLINLREYRTDEEIAELASQYTGRAKFMRGCPGAYSSACKRGILDKVCSHMEPAANLLYRVVYSYEWPESNTAYVGLTWNEKERMWGHLHKNEKGKRSPVRKYVEEGNEKYDYKTLTDYMPAKEAGLEEKRIIQDYKDKGWKLLNKTKGGELGSICHELLKQ